MTYRFSYIRIRGFVNLQQITNPLFYYVGSIPIQKSAEHITERRFPYPNNSLVIYSMIFKGKYVKKKPHRHIDLYLCGFNVDIIYINANYYVLFNIQSVLFFRCPQTL